MKNAPKPPRGRRPTHWENIDDPWSLDSNLHGHLLAALLRERKQEYCCKKIVKRSNDEDTERQTMIVGVCRKNLDGGSQRKLGSKVAKLRKMSDLEDPTPSIDQVYLGCTRRAATVDEETIRTRH